ncbi:DNA adenine methylase [Psychrobacillus vulpis]|nr:DNA adenine methylase [Psychrobacillus vulpis]
MRSPIKWVGGKYKLAKHLVSIIPPHEGYVEVFGGAGWVLFAKPTSKWEVLNDLDNNLFNFWHVIRNQKEEFIKSFQYEIISRTSFNNYKQIYKSNSYKDSIEKAHILYYLLEAGIGASLPDGGGSGFGAAKDRSRLRLDKLPDDIEKAYDRLINVTIECKDFREIIKFYDSHTTFFYLDPPYRNTRRTSYPVGNFTDKDYEDLYLLCKDIKGKFLLTLNNDPFIQSLFSEFTILDKRVYYNVSTSNKGRGDFSELIILNYSQCYS